ncbi:conserved hypothetical protein [Ricinus communis]|uniref:Uncharacterized protein n=1 Tax=Ricinus communis TaxID=3988 RepID=B9SBR3_RICCO|nr:conserved hypothetical protein [Ricinus communis]
MSFTKEVPSKEKVGSSPSQKDGTPPPLSKEMKEGSSKRLALEGSLARPAKQIKLSKDITPLMASTKFAEMVTKKYREDALVSHPTIAMDIIRAIQLPKDQEFFTGEITDVEVAGFTYGYLALVRFLISL